jgi:hypothetical protein
MVIDADAAGAKDAPRVLARHAIGHIRQQARYAAQKKQMQQQNENQRQQ